MLHLSIGSNGKDPKEYKFPKLQPCDPTPRCIKGTYRSKECCYDLCIPYFVCSNVQYSTLVVELQYLYSYAMLHYYLTFIYKLVKFNVMIEMHDYFASLITRKVRDARPHRSFFSFFFFWLLPVQRQPARESHLSILFRRVYKRLHFLCYSILF